MTLLVFLIEDDLKIQKQLMAAMTALLDARFVGTVQSEPEATRWLNHHQGQWNLVVVDLFINEGTGFSVLTHMRRPTTQEHVVVLTNSATAENRKHAIECGAQAVFDKTQEIEQFFTYCGKLDNNTLSNAEI